MKDTAIELSEELRDPNGEHKVEVVIALTHCRVPNVSRRLIIEGVKRECNGYALQKVLAE